MRPSAPPLLFWNVRASTTCSRVTLPIFVSTRPIGRPWSWSMAGMAVAPPPAVGEAVPPAGRFDFGAAAPGAPDAGRAIGAVPGRAAPAAPAGRAAPGAAGAPAGRAAPGAGRTLFAGWPPAVGGALAPTVGALTVVTFGLFAATPGPVAGAPACGAGRCGCWGDPGVGFGGVTRDISTSFRSVQLQLGIKKSAIRITSFPRWPAVARGWPRLGPLCRRHRRRPPPHRRHRRRRLPPPRP